jgi:hypothetical protein
LARDFSKKKKKKEKEREKKINVGKAPCALERKRADGLKQTDYDTTS